ncbi:MAG: putative transcriptional regulatory protein [Lentisphaerae bacterium ADurb.BinA184]|nr:MAG: putative transcriptional regulatory protein [Lentisphaerae bacterium ADurb.BinA184]
MSGHSKWSSIKHKKGAADAKRGKLFSKLAKEISLAARGGGGDLETNARLRQAVMAARSANMPNDNVERAIKKGTGGLEGSQLVELSYEAYGPGGVAFFITCLSDNRNRTVASVRSLFTRHNINQAGGGAVSRLFQRKARFVVEGPSADEDKVLELLLDGGADVDSVEASEGTVEILAPPDQFDTIGGLLDKAGLHPTQAAINFMPLTTVQVTDPVVARAVVRFLDAAEDDDDVQNVYSNFEMSDEMMAMLAKE